MNQNFTHLLGQLREIWKQLGFNHRLSIVLAGAAVVVGLGSLAFWSNRTDYKLLYGGLDDAESAKVIAALDEAKVAYELGRGGGAILVPADKVYKMRMQLAGRGIPQRSGAGVGLEIFDKPNFGISDFAQRVNYIRAVQGELARTISQMDEIETARVMIVMPENRLLVDSQKRPTASVLVRTKGQGQLPASAVSSIRFLIANAVEGLSPNQVSVVDNHGNVLSENSDNDSLAGLTGNQLNTRRNLEGYLAKKAQGMLDKALGVGQSVVQVSVEIDYESLTTVDEKFGEGTPRSKTKKTEIDTSATANSSGAPGITSNANTETNAAPAAVPVNNQHKEKEEVTDTYDNNKTVTNMGKLAGGTKRLTAAVLVAQKYEGTGAARKPVKRSPEELLSLRRIVQTALGIQELGDAGRKDEIVLEETLFNEQPTLELTQRLDQQQQQQFWWDLGRTALYPALAFGVLFFFWRALKRTTTTDIPIGVPLGQLNGNGHAHEEPEPGVVTAEVLNQLIRENPANMTQSVRAWLLRSKPAK